jgi:hypothetical protein
VTTRLRSKPIHCGDCGTVLPPWETMIVPVATVCRYLCVPCWQASEAERLRAEEPVPYQEAA